MRHASTVGQRLPTPAQRSWFPQWPKVLNAGLAEVDPDLFDIIEKEKNRQFKVRLLRGFYFLPPLHLHTQACLHCSMPTACPCITLTALGT